ncbi:hypothetical protein D3C80_1428360 [compost metagenome]
MLIIEHVAVRVVFELLACRVTPFSKGVGDFDQLAGVVKGIAENRNVAFSILERCRTALNIVLGIEME